MSQVLGRPSKHRARRASPRSEGASARQQVQHRRRVPLRPTRRQQSLAQKPRADVAQAQALGAQLHRSRCRRLLVALDLNHRGLNARRILAILAHRMAGSLQHLIDAARVPALAARGQALLLQALDDLRRGSLLQMQRADPLDRLLFLRMLDDEPPPIGIDLAGVAPAIGNPTESSA